VQLRLSVSGPTTAGTTPAPALTFRASRAPAGGAAAAAPEGGALARPSAFPRLPVVGAGNPVAVLGLAR
jgi:hypothetical protein